MHCCLYMPVTGDVSMQQLCCILPSQIQELSGQRRLRLTQSEHFFLCRRVLRSSTLIGGHAGGCSSGGLAPGSGAALLAADAPGEGTAFAWDCGGVGGLAAAGRLWLGLHKQRATI